MNVTWRFVVFQGEARRIFGEKLSNVLVAVEEAEGPSEVKLQTERERFLRAPVVVAVISSTNQERGVPEIEQILSSGAACCNLCLAANALGYGTSWITEWYALSPGIHDVLRLGDNEQIAGFEYVGTANEKQDDRDRPMFDAIFEHWND